MFRMTTMEGWAMSVLYNVSPKQISFLFIFFTAPGAFHVPVSTVLKRTHLRPQMLP